MANLFETVDIERSLLKLITSSKMIARQHIGQIKSEWFSSSERKFVFDTALRVFLESGSVLKKKIFEFEVNKDKKVSRNKELYGAEWNLIDQTVVDEDIDALVLLLEEAELGKKSLDISRKVIQSLESGDVKTAVTTLKRESVMLDQKGLDKPVVEIADYQHRKDLIADKRQNPDKYKGLHSGFSKFDSLTGGFYKAELTLIAAVTGVGKSTLMKAIEVNMAIGGWNVLHVTNEENREQVELKFDSIISKIPYLNFKRATVTDKEIDDWEKSMIKMKKHYGRIFVKEVPQFSTVLEVERVYYELQQKGIKIDAIVIDYLDHVAPVEKAWSENDEAAKAAADCKGLAIALDLPVITATQAATIVDQKQEKGRSFGRLDVYGSKRKIHPTNIFMGILLRGTTDDPAKESEKQDRIWEVAILKNRDGPPFRFDLVQRVETGVVEDYEDNNAIKTLKGMYSDKKEDEKEDNEEDGGLVEEEESENKEKSKKKEKGSFEVKTEIEQEIEAGILSQELSQEDKLVEKQSAPSSIKGLVKSKKIS